MHLHKNARLTPILRDELAQKVIRDSLPVTAAAKEYNVSSHTAAKWVRRFREEGRRGLIDRSSRPHLSPRRLSPERSRSAARGNKRGRSVERTRPNANASQQSHALRLGGRWRVTLSPRNTPRKSIYRVTSMLPRPAVRRGAASPACAVFRRVYRQAPCSSLQSCKQCR